MHPPQPGRKPSWISGRPILVLLLFVAMIKLQLLAKGSVDPSPLLTGVVGLEGVPAAFDALEAADRHAKILIDPTLTGAEVRPR